jgi:hypothetical protein
VRKTLSDIHRGLLKVAQQTDSGANGIGRNNWTFFGSDDGGKTAAILRSFVTSCELAKVDPFAWFRDVLGRIAEYPVKRIEELLPHRWVPVAL